MKSLFKHLRAIAPLSQTKIFPKRCFTSIFLTLLTTLPSTTLFLLFPSQRTLAQAVTCQSVYDEVYAVTQAAGTPDFHAIHGPTGAAVKFTSAPSSFGISAINTAATDHVNKMVYYGDANKIYAWDAISNQHITVAANFQSLLTSAGYTGRFVTLSSGGAAFYGGALYVGVDGTTTQDFEIFRVNLSADGETAVSVTPLQIKTKSGGVFNNNTQDDWGDFIISDAGVILALSNNRQTNQRRFWRFDLNTNTYVAASNTNENLQLAKSGDGRIWGLRSNNTVVEVSPSGSVISSPVSTTVNAFDGAECVVGEASVGDRVWEDTDGDGVQDAGEPGIAGVTVAIYRDINKNGVINTGEPKLATQVTDTNGNYDFIELLPHDRATGTGHNDFIVNVESGVPTSYTATTPTQQNADFSSATEDFNNTDFGYKPPTYSISGTLYEDRDGGDDLDAGEPKLPANITLKLLDNSNNVIATTITDANGAYTFTGVLNGNYKIQVDITDTDIPTGYALGTPNDLAVNVSGSGVTNQNFGFDKYEVSPSAGKVIINEVLYNETDNTAATNDEFIEIYNASTSPVDLGGWKLMDGNIIANDTDNTGSITGSSTPYAFPNSTILKPGEYAVIWVGDNTNTPDRTATGATFQAWLGKAPKLNNSGDDMWLYDKDNKIVDYIAYGSGTAVNTPPPTFLNLWNSTYQSALATAKDGQSISLTRNGLDGNTSACWEPTTSGNAKTQGCTNYLPTIDSDTIGIRVTSVGENNNGTPKVLLVKRITAINGQTTNPNDNTTPLNVFVDDTASDRKDDDNHPNWASDYLKGAINGGSVKPGDELEYTIYFLSSGSTPAKNVLLCDRVPENVTFIPNSFNNQAQATGGLQSADRGILWLKDGNTESLTNVQDGDFAQYFPPSIEPDTVYPKIKCDGLNTNGAVVVNLQNLPNATGSGTPNTSYGFIRFRGRVK